MAYLRITVVALALVLSALMGTGCSDDSAPLVIPTDVPVPPVDWPDPYEVDVWRADVTFQGSTVRYVGHLGRAGVDHFFRTIDEYGEPLDTLEIASVSGTPEHARRLADWVAEHQITVVVEEICFSECANYVFIAAPQRILRNHGLVAWHGVWGDAVQLAPRYGMSIDEYVDAQIEAEQSSMDAPVGLDSGSTTSEAIAERMRQLIVASIRVNDDEIRWLKQFEFDLDVVIYGKLPQHAMEYREVEASGWTFSIKDMVKFGIHNVRYEGEGDYPSVVALARMNAYLYELD